MSRHLRLYPDPDLTAVSRDVGDQEDIHGLVRDLVRICRAHRGLGLAAPQIGDNRRVFVLDPSAGTDLSRVSVHINPRIIKRKGGIALGAEGCLSIPGFESRVKRHKRIVLAWEDQRERERHHKWLSGLEARAAQHELDHLHGILFTRLLVGAERERAEVHLRRMVS